MKNPLYQEKLNRFRTALEKGTPDIVPVFPMIETWAQLNTGISIRDSFMKDPMICYEAFSKIYENIYVDASYGTGNLIPLHMLSRFGEGIYQVTDEGVQIKGSHGSILKPEEYPQFNANPYEFIMETLLPRKYPSLNSDRDIVIEKWYKGLMDFIGWSEYDGETVKNIEEKLNVPVVIKGATIMPPDVLLDFLRDFVGVSTDIRRRPKEFLEACDTLFPIMVKMALGSDPKPEEGNLMFCPLHLPTFLKPSDFEKFYFPSWKRMTQELFNLGYKVFYYMENDWMPYLDYLQDMPDGEMVGLFEKGDLGKIKDKVGNKFTVMGGMPLNLLKHGTIEQCVDQAKKCLDEYAPGGNYIFSTDMNLLSKDDAKIENLSAVCEYIHINGKY